MAGSPALNSDSQRLDNNATVPATGHRISIDTDALSQVTVNDRADDARSLKTQISLPAWATSSSQSVARTSFTKGDKHRSWSHDASNLPSLPQLRPSLTHSSSDHGLQTPFCPQELSASPLSGRSSGLDNRAVDPLLPGHDHGHPSSDLITNRYETNMQRPVMVEICPWEINNGAPLPPAASVARSAVPAGRQPWSAAMPLALRSDATPPAHSWGLINGTSLSAPRTISHCNWTGEKIAGTKADGHYQCHTAEQAAAFHLGPFRRWIWQRHPAFWIINVMLMLGLVAAVLVGGRLSRGQVCQRGWVRQVPLCQAVIVAQCQQVRPCGDPLQYYLTMAGGCACSTTQLD
ncbi:hypothetical protein H4R34_004336 [Dimargaris verticillata]|uniref:Uncharacterized protein n=1 Tax=Dimargaris verticillata TaxID=2761393 RepID=A0A9W8B5S8_9FUNG|nr:hypothetical protein H4R34_004336 [Dimargaris verticillata]